MGFFIPMPKSFEEIIRQYHPETSVEIIKENTDYNFKIKTSDLGKNKLVFTEGLVNFNQPVDEKNKLYRNIELYILMPGYWNQKTEHWPIKWIAFLAEFPKKKNAWFGPGDTIPAGNPPKPLSQSFAANNFMLIEPLAIQYLFDDLSSEIPFKPLAIVPIFEIETHYKLRNSATVLVHKLTHANHTELVDIYRKPVCRKRILGF